jgi:predicted amidohydrolase YtcJ
MKKYIFILLCALLFACAQKRTGTTDKNSDAPAGAVIMYHNGDILTMEGDSPRYVEAVVVKDGKILFAGNKADAMREAGAGHQMVDLQGKCMMPGLQDTHGHVLMLAHNLDRKNLGHMTSIEEAIDTMKAFIAERKPKPGEWILAYQNPSPFNLKEKRLLLAEDIDRISADVPVFIADASGHLATLNHAGMKALNITAATPDPPGGTIRRKSGSREPNGIVDEAMVIRVYKMLPAISRERQQPLLDQAIGFWTQYGYTTARDQLFALNADDVELAKTWMASGTAPIDLILFPDAYEADKVLTELPGLDSGYRKRLRIGGIKMMMDGVPNGYTAYMRKPYANVPPEYKKGYRGVPNMPKADVMKYFDKYYNTNLQVNAHAMGDAAIADYFDCLEAAMKKYGKKDKRPICQHSGYVPFDLVDRYRDAGAIASFNSFAVSQLGPVIENLFGKGTAGNVMPARRLLDKGVMVTINSDCPTGPSVPNVFNDMYALVTRKHLSSDFVADPSECITVYEALTAVTRAGAYANFEEKIKGTITPGKLADLVILDRNPLKIDPTSLREVVVLETIKEGKIVYKK